MPDHDLIHSSVQKYYILASVTFLFYDIVTTLDIEIERVWRGKLSAFIILWTLVNSLLRWSQHRLSDRANLKQNRWLPVLAYIFVIWLAHSASISPNVSLQG